MSIIFQTFSNYSFSLVFYVLEELGGSLVGFCILLITLTDTMPEKIRLDNRTKMIKKSIKLF